MNAWRVLKSREDKGAMQMAIDEAILTARSKNQVPNTLRFFTWKPVAVTIGFFQSLEQEIDVKKTSELGIDIIRRYTGGGAVLHDKELTYSMTLSEKDVPQDIIESYKKICAGIVNGLKSIGIDSAFSPINDIIVNGKKISGNAQTRRSGVVLQHGTILLDVDAKKMFSVLKVPDEKIRDKSIKNVEERVTSLKKELGGRDITLKDLEKALTAGFEQVFDVKFAEGELTLGEIKTAERLYKEKYSTREWCYWR